VGVTVETQHGLMGTVPVIEITRDIDRILLDLSGSRYTDNAYVA
jgi:hypothetical protein